MGLAESILERWRRAVPGTSPVTLLDDLGERALTGEELILLARRHAAALAALGVGPGDRVGLVLPTGERFLGTFFGAWQLGACAVPLAPPAPRQDPAGEAERLERALRTADVRLAVVSPEASALLADRELPLLAPADQETATWEHLAGPRSVAQVAAGETPALPGSRDPLVIQFSSGSTGHPRGVMLSDDNLQANVEAIAAVLRPAPDDVGVAWLPLHHDMGLIGCLLFTQFFGIPLVLLAPEFFIRGPVRWLDAMSRHGATMTSAPNFAYHLCAGLSAAQTGSVDLRRLRAALVGAEPVRPGVLRAFAARYRESGFEERAFVPTYGLAEATLAVTMTPPGRGMAQDGELPSVGPPLPGVSVSIHDPDRGEALPDGQVGEIRVGGRSVSEGYYGDAEATRSALVGGMLRTGDLGYLADGELYVSGRIKDLIIKGGQKYHPQDLEAVAEAHAGVRAGGAACFLVPRSRDREDRLVMVLEVNPGRVPPDIGGDVRRQVLDRAGVRLDEVLLVVPQQLPRTTSGKLRRSAARERYLAGAFTRVDG